MQNSRASVIVSVSVLLACGAPTYPFDPLDPDWADIGRRCRPNEPALSLSPALRAPLDPDYFNVDTPDAAWAKAARVTPGGFAGHYFDYKQKKTFLLLVQPERRAEAVQALRSAGGIGPVDWESATVRAARWDFGQLYDWKGYITSKLPISSGASVFDIDETRNRISIHVLSSERRRQLESHLAVLGLPCFLVAIDF